MQAFVFVAGHGIDSMLRPHFARYTYIGTFFNTFTTNFKQMIRVVSFAFLILCTLAAFGQDRNIPPAIQVNESSKLIIHAYAKGVQVYVCQQDPKDTSKFVWIFKAPRATLYADSSYQQVIGKHYFNQSGSPTWESTDGSSVSGAKLQQVNSPDQLAIPWLLLKATLTQGAGILKATTFIQRLFTKGGKAPVGADSWQKGKYVEIPYTAEYLFYSEK